MERKKEEKKLSFRFFLVCSYVLFCEASSFNWFAVEPPLLHRNRWWAKVVEQLHLKKKFTGEGMKRAQVHAKMSEYKRVL